MAYRRIGTIKSVAEFRAYLESQRIDLEVDDAPLSADEGSPLGLPFDVAGFQVGNRWAIHPMEGWDANRDGTPSERTTRRWRHFGESGAKLIWGGEAFAVQMSGRANPNQLFFHPENRAPMRELLSQLTSAHTEQFGTNSADDLLVGLQLTHSGRFSRPNDKVRPEPQILYHHPLLDRRVGVAPDDDQRVLSDGEIRALIDDFVSAAKMAAEIGFRFVDIKHCHGYLGHEFLSAYTRPGPYGGDLAGRSLFLRQICEGIRAECPELLLGVRLSIFDTAAFEPNPETGTARKLGVGRPEIESAENYPGFGCDRMSPLEMRLEEPLQLLQLMHREFGVHIVNVSAASPYYNPHLMRPAFYPPSDGYQPPEEPLLGCARHFEAVRTIKNAVPDLPLVGSAYSYLQDYLPHVAQPLVRNGDVDFVGLGRMVLSYWQLPADVLGGHGLRLSKKICRTFSDCTTAPRHGIVSGCYPLDDAYKGTPEYEQLKAVKSGIQR